MKLRRLVIEDYKQFVGRVAIDDLPNLARWRDQIRARPAVQRGIEMPPSSLDLEGDREEQAKAFSDKVRNMVETGQSRGGGV